MINNYYFYAKVLALDYIAYMLINHHRVGKDNNIHNELLIAFQELQQILKMLAV